MRDSLADERVGVRHCAAILAPSTPAGRLRDSTKSTNRSEFAVIWRQTKHYGLGNELIVEVDFGVRTCVWSQLDSQQIEGTMKLIRVIFVSALIMVATAAAPQQPTSQMSKAGALRTKVVLLGTGTPVPDPERSGPATAMIVAEEATASLRASRREVVR